MVGEYIRRSDALAAVAALWKDYGQDGVYKAINRIVPVEVRPVTHAHWVKYTTLYHFCSNCTLLITGFTAEDVANKFLYCPGCGAEMDGDT